MRVMAWVLIASVFPAASADAQRNAAHGPPSVPAAGSATPLHHCATRGALAPIGLPLPPIGLPPIEQPRHGRHRYRYPVYHGQVCIFTCLNGKLRSPPTEEPRPAESPASGRLIMDLEPAEAEVFADGYYVGVLEDFSGARGGGLLTAGLHRIDVSARGFESLTRVINVTAGQAVTVRGSLKALPPPVGSLALFSISFLGVIWVTSLQTRRAAATCDQSRATTWIP